jgi:hypothetical protein
MKALINAGGIVDQASDGGTTPLFVASVFGKADVVKALLSEGAYRNTVCFTKNSPTGPTGVTSLSIALFQIHAKVVALLRL